MTKYSCIWVGAKTFLLMQAYNQKGSRTHFEPDSTGCTKGLIKEGGIWAVLGNVKKSGMVREQKMTGAAGV